MLKQLYHNIIRSAEKRPEKIHHGKTVLAEYYAIHRKKQLYQAVSWTQEQQKRFDDYWKTVYGKTISNRWHRLYQAASDEFCVDYIPEMLYTTKIEPAMNDYRYASVLEDKSLIESLCRDCGCVVPKTVIVCSAGQYFDGERKPITSAEAIQRIRQEKSVVCKPTVGSSSGKGIRIFTVAEKTDEELARLLFEMGQDFIIQQKIIPHPDFAAFNESSINTIRITTYILDGKLYHVPIAFRIGRKNSSVDNIHAGGIGVGVEDDGTLLKYAFDLGYGDKVVKHEAHPDSKISFDGYRLPNIAQIIQSAYSVHGTMPHIGIVSWDYTVDVDGNAVLIEANLYGQGIWFPQMIHGKGAFGENTAQILEIIKQNRK